MLFILTYGLQLKLFPKKVRIGPKMSQIHENHEILKDL